MTDPTSKNDETTVADGGVALDACPRNCGHPWDDHVLTAVGTATVGSAGDLPIAGTITCPNDDCLCVGTWSLVITPPNVREEKGSCTETEEASPSSSTS